MWRTALAIFCISAAVLATTEVSELSTCPKGFEREGMYCYHVGEEETNWFGAIKICKQKNSSLAKPLTQDIDNLLRRHLAHPRFKSVERWIDITYNPELRHWVLGTTNKRIPYDGFARKTSEIEVDHHCAVMDPKKSYAWVARTCHELYNYVCQKPQATVVASESIDESPVCPEDFWHVGMNCYYIGKKKVTWKDAKTICKDINSTLAKSITRDIDGQLRAHLASPTFESVERWIDIRYHTKNKEWVLGGTSEKIPYDGFWEEESTKNPDQHCAVMEPKESYAWVPMMCHELKYAVCEISLADASTSPVLALSLLSDTALTTDSFNYSIDQAPTKIRRRRACPKGFRRGGMNCYHVSRERAIWSDAIQVCRGKNSNLANPFTEDFNEQLRNVTARFRQVERWIDVTYNPKLRDWVLGTTAKEIPYTGFFEKPLNNQTDWHCGVVDPKHDFAWTPRMCNMRKHYVCQMPRRKFRKQSPKKLNSTSKTIEQQKTKSHTLKTKKTQNQNNMSEPSYALRRIKKESSLSLKSAPETESRVKNVVKSEDSNIPDQPKEHPTKPFTGNYRTESRIPAAEPSSSLIEPTLLTNIRSCVT